LQLAYCRRKINRAARLLGKRTMSWARIMAPLSGAPSDGAVLEAAAALADPFDAELAAVFAPADAADLMPWMGEGFMGGVQVAALDSLKEAAEIGQRHAHTHVSGCPYGRKTFAALQSPVSSALAMEARLSDVVVFGPDAAKGRGPLAEAFQQILMEERRPVLIARALPTLTDTAAVAWDGGREATRAARIAAPWLQKAARVVILTAPAATPRDVEPERLKALFAQRGVTAEVEVLSQPGDAGPTLLAAAKACGATMLVAGAFGHPRFQEFIFGGTTRHLMQAEDGPSLFFTH
jgi:nucleotide-binding universal stress UspA family protein